MALSLAPLSLNLAKSKPELINENTYLVPSQFDSNKKYKVTHLDSYSCECKDFQTRGKDKGMFCKHIKAIQFYLAFKNTSSFSNNKAIYTIIFIVLFAVLDEIHQINTPGRFFSVHDILTDSFASIAITSLFNSSICARIACSCVV